MRLKLIGFLLYATALAAVAREELPPAEIGGLLLDHTFSAAGTAFAREFAERWNDLDRAGSFSLNIIERPEPRGGTRAWVELNGQTIVVVPLSPGRPAPAQAAVEAAYTRAVDLALTPQRNWLEQPVPPEQKIE